MMDRVGGACSRGEVSWLGRSLCLGKESGLGLGWAEPPEGGGALFWEDVPSRAGLGLGGPSLTARASEQALLRVEAAAWTLK